MSIEIAWRAEFTSAEASALHADAFSTAPSNDPPQGWRAQVRAHSLGWATARRHEVLVGFLNVIWDGAGHAWLQDVMVATDARHQSMGTALVAHRPRRSRPGRLSVAARRLRPGPASVLPRRLLLPGQPGRTAAPGPRR